MRNTQKLIPYNPRGNHKTEISHQNGGIDMTFKFKEPVDPKEAYSLWDEFYTNSKYASKKPSSISIIPDLNIFNGKWPVDLYSRESLDKTIRKSDKYF